MSPLIVALNAHLARAQAWSPPRTANGRPDLQGIAVRTLEKASK